MVLANTGNILSGFFFSHHTFTHQNLDNATTYDATQQLALNTKMAAALGLTGKPAFSSKCMVTPQISGLANGDVLAAIKLQGVECAVGDNTWGHLKNKESPHQMLYSTLEKNGFAGFAIMPRFATEIYYNSTTPAQNEALYNFLYQPYFGAASTLDDIVKREAVRVVRDGLLSLRKDPHMMHQANMLIDSATG